MAIFFFNNLQIFAFHHYDMNNKAHKLSEFMRLIIYCRWELFPICAKKITTKVCEGVLQV